MSIDIKNATIEQLELELQNKKDYADSQSVGLFKNALSDLIRNFDMGLYSNIDFVGEVDNAVSQVKSLMYTKE